jgi:hypothetical protein
MIVFDKGLESLNGLAQSEAFWRITGWVNLFAIGKELIIFEQLTIPKHLAVLYLLTNKQIKLMYEVICEMKPFFKQKATSLGLTVFLLILINKLVVDMLFLFNQVEDVGDILLEEFVFGVGLGLDLATKSGLDELSDLLVV